MEQALLLRVKLQPRRNTNNVCIIYHWINIEPAVIGLSLGLIGGGGSILTVPILVYLLGVGPHEAVGMSLAVVGATSILGSYLHWRKDGVDLSSGLLFGLSGIVGAFIGSPLTKLVSAEVLLLLFGLLMFIVAVSMIWRRKHAISDKPHKPHPFSGDPCRIGRRSIDRVSRGWRRIFDRPGTGFFRRAGYEKGDRNIVVRYFPELLSGRTDRPY